MLIQARIELTKAMVSRSTLIADVLFFLKDAISSNVSDPLGSRSGTAQFVNTSYPERNVVYPIVTIKVQNLEAARVGLQTDTMDFIITVEIRVWARNQKEKDSIYQDILEHLASTQYSGSGSIENDLHDFTILSSVEVDEPGKGGIKSRIMECQYAYFDNT